MNQNLEWDKFSAFNQNRYLEEAQRLAKPGLVAQRKALFEEHFKKPMADKLPSLLKVRKLDTKNEVRLVKNDFNKENFYEEPVKDMGSSKSVSGLYTTTAKSRTNALWIVEHPLIESLSGEVYDAVESDAIAENKSTRVLDVLEQINGHGSNMAAGASEDHEVSQHLESSNDSCVDHKVSEPKPLEICGLITAFNQSKIVDITTSPVVINLDKIAVKESMDKIDLASTGDSEPSFSSSNTSTSFKKHAVRSPCKLRSRVIPMKENNAPENPMVSGTCMVNRQRVVHKPLEVPINHNSSITPTVKEVYNVNYHVNTVRARGSKVKVHSDQVKKSTSLEALSSNRKSLAKHVLKPAPTQLKQKMNITRANMASMRKSVGQKEISKMKTPAFSQRNGTKSICISTSPAMLKTFSSRAPVSQVLFDATNMGKHTISSSNTSTFFGRKLAVQSSTKSHNKYGSKVIQINSALTAKNSNKSLPKKPSPSCNYEIVKRPTMTPRCRSSRNTTLDARLVSKVSSIFMQESLQKSMQALATVQIDDKGSKRPSTSTRLQEQLSGVKTTKRSPAATTVTPFRFRSDERAAIRKQKLEDKCSVEAENLSQIKRKGLGNNKRHKPSACSSNKR